MCGGFRRSVNVESIEQFCYQLKTQTDNTLEHENASKLEANAVLRGRHKVRGWTKQYNLSRHQRSLNESYNSHITCALQIWRAAFCVRFVWNTQPSLLTTGLMIVKSRTPASFWEGFDWSCSEALNLSLHPSIMGTTKMLEEVCQTLRWVVLYWWTITTRCRLAAVDVDKGPFVLHPSETKLAYVGGLPFGICDPFNTISAKVKCQWNETRADSHSIFYNHESIFHRLGCLCISTTTEQY